ncbi:MAG: cobalamin-dependent protein [Firmicutes bacterium]|nr:cobalamin-dependent protein [Bacillota bacterium]
MKIRPYGDTSHDGKVQLSFTLPVSSNGLGISAAKELAKKMGLVNPQVVHMEDIHEGYCFFVVYGSVPYEIETDLLKNEEIENVSLSKEDIEALIERNFNRELVFVGASTGSDAHTVGIDAIMNMKGFAGHYGLERYKGIRAYNLGSQVENEEFVRFARKVKADVLLVSQTVTQKDVHIKNLIHLVELLEAENMRKDVILIAGGARITNELAKELGYDAGFGPKKYAEDVAAYAVERLIEKNK